MEIYKLDNPFKQIESVAIVKLHPHQMNCDYYIHLKRSLEKRIIGKCNNEGMFTAVIKLTDYSENEINPENFSGDAEYKVRFIATICVPIERTAVILRVENILSLYEDFLIRAFNGYVTCALQLSENKGIIYMNKGQIMFTGSNKPLMKGDYIKVSIISKRVEANDKRIGITGQLLDLATEEEVKLYYRSKYEVYEENEKEVTENVIFNDDEADENKDISDV